MTTPLATLLAALGLGVLVSVWLAWKLGRAQAARVAAEKERDDWRAAWFAADEARWHFIMRLDEAEGRTRAVEPHHPQSKLTSTRPGADVRPPRRAGVGARGGVAALRPQAVTQPDPLRQG